MKMTSQQFFLSVCFATVITTAAASAEERKFDDSDVQNLKSLFANNDYLRGQVEKEIGRLKIHTGLGEQCKVFLIKETIAMEPQYFPIEKQRFLLPFSSFALWDVTKPALLYHVFNIDDAMYSKTTEEKGASTGAGQDIEITLAPRMEYPSDAYVSSHLNELEDKTDNAPAKKVNHKNGAIYYSVLPYVLPGPDFTPMSQEALKNTCYVDVNFRSNCICVGS